MEQKTATSRATKCVLFNRLLASSQYPKGPALTGHLDKGFSWFPCLKANAEMVPNTASCYCKLLM
jgi:hypothetical protein